MVETNKQQIEDDLKIKQEELKNLEAQVLDEAKTKQKEELVKKIEELQKQLDELKKVETDVYTAKTSSEVKEVKEDIENKEQTYELIKGTEMETKLKEAGKTDVEVKEFALKIDAVVRKYLNSELKEFPNTIKNGMSTGIQFAMMEALIAQGESSSTDVFDATGEGLSEDGLTGFMDKITGFVGNITDIASKVLGPLAKGGAFASLAKKVNNMTTFINLNKDKITGSVPELVNPYKCKELLNNDVWSDVANFDKPETLALFTLNSTEGGELSEEEKIKLQDIANNQKMPISDKMLASIEKSLDSADGFLDKRSGWQDKFADIFDMIRKPLLALGIDLKPSDILGHGILATALGVSALDAKYIKADDLDKNVSKNKEIDEKELKENIEKELKKYNSPVTSNMVINTSKEYDVPVEYIMAFMKNDSSYGTAGLAVKTKNPGNVGNTDDGSKKYFENWEDGVNAVGSNLESRISAYHKKVNKDKMPTVKELATGKSEGGKKFFGVYMTAPEGANSVKKIEEDLISQGINTIESFEKAA